MQYESQNKWIKENTLIIAAKLHNKYDSDIIEFIKKQNSRSDTIKRALRLLMEKEKTENE